ncbi:unnamed protein product [Peniophora sp. CBMAI 1063]|nr:unnamed protein product [Peniophora sp. CBMAI 1063]
MSAPVQASSTQRIPRKPVPKFNYDALYPAPDLHDPLAPLAVLRNRHPEGASTQLPVLNIPALNMPILPLPAETAPPPSIRRQTIVAMPSDKRKRSLSVVGPAKATSKADRRKTAILGISAPIATSTAPAVPSVPRIPVAFPVARAPRSASRPSTADSIRPGTGRSISSNSSSASSMLSDLSDWPDHLIHKLGDPEVTLAQDARKNMRPMAVDEPAPSMRRTHTPLPIAPVPSPAGPNTLKKKGSRTSLAARMFSSRSSTPVPTSPPPKVAKLPSSAASTSGNDSGYETATSNLTPPSSASSSSTASGSSVEAATPHAPSRSPSPLRAPSPLQAPKRKSSMGVLKHHSSAALKRQSAAAALVLAAESEPEDESRARRRTISTTSRARSKSVSQQPRSRSTEHVGAGSGVAPRPSLKSLMSLPTPPPVPVIPKVQRAEAREAKAKGGEARVDIQVKAPTPMHPLVRTTSLRDTPPSRPKRSHLRSVSDPDALASAVRSQLAAAPIPPVPSIAARAASPTQRAASPSPARTATPTSARSGSPRKGPPVPLDLPEEPASALSARYKPHAKSPKPTARAPSETQPAPVPVPALPMKIPLAEVERRPQVVRTRTSMPRLNRLRSSTMNGECTSPTSPTSPSRRRAAPFSRSFTSLPLPHAKSSHAHLPPSPDPMGAVLPSAAQLARAAEMVVLQENGTPVPFGSLWKEKRSAVIFIRHFWCPSCREYLAGVVRAADTAALERAGAQLLIVGCGDFNLIKSYRQTFRMPFQLVVDPSHGQQLYRTLGMNMLLPPGLGGVQPSGGAKGRVRSAAFVFKTTLRAGVPAWGRGGDSSQLGGEFVLGPGLRCTYAHRMQSVRGHAPVEEVLAAVGVMTSATSVRVWLPDHADEESGSEKEIVEKKSTHAPGITFEDSKRSIGWESTESTVLVGFMGFELISGYRGTDTMRLERFEYSFTSLTSYKFYDARYLYFMFTTASLFLRPVEPL